MKRKRQGFLAVLLSLVMCLSLVACADEEDVLVDNSQGNEITGQSDVQAKDGS